MCFKFIFMINKDFIQRALNYFHRRFDSPLGYARYIGVSIGEGNLIGKDHWSSEPYLITVGNNCQLTNCKIFTHGGVKLLDILTQNSTYLVK